MLTVHANLSKFSFLRSNFLIVFRKINLPTNFFALTCKFFPIVKKIQIVWTSWRRRREVKKTNLALNFDFFWPNTTFFTFFFYFFFTCKKTCLIHLPVIFEIKLVFDLRRLVCINKLGATTLGQKILPNPKFWLFWPNTTSFYLIFPFFDMSKKNFP